MGREARRRERERAEVARAKSRIDQIKGRIDRGEPLTEADHRIIQNCGPKTRAYIGYVPRVVLR